MSILYRPELTMNNFVQTLIKHPFLKGKNGYLYELINNWITKYGLIDIFSRIENQLIYELHPSLYHLLKQLGLHHLCNISSHRVDSYGLIVTSAKFYGKSIKEMEQDIIQLINYEYVTQKMIHSHLYNQTIKFIIRYLLLTFSYFLHWIEIATILEIDDLYLVQELVNCTNDIGSIQSVDLVQIRDHLDPHIFFHLKKDYGSKLDDYLASKIRKIILFYNEGLELIKQLDPHQKEKIFNQVYEMGFIIEIEWVYQKNIRNPKSLYFFLVSWYLQQKNKSKAHL